MNIRKLFFALLVTALVLVLLPATVFAARDDAVPLSLDTRIDAQLLERDDSAWLSFTPEQTGGYILQSFSDQDTIAFLYTAQMILLAEDDDSGPETNFCLSYWLEAGVTYYYEVRYLGTIATDPIPVKLSLSPIKSISNATATVTEYSRGAWSYIYGENEEKLHFYRYDYCGAAEYTVTFTDNSTMQVSGEAFEHEGTTYFVTADDQQGPLQPWEGGNTYTGTLSVGGVSCDIAVTVEDVPVKSLQIDPITLVENTNGWMDSYWDEEKEELVDYYCYNWEYDLSGTVTFADNSTARISGLWFSYGQQDINLGCDSKQGSGEVWTTGNTYQATVFLGDLSVTVPVTIIDSPVKKIEVQPVTVYADLDAHEYWTDGGTPFIGYAWEDKLVLTVTFLDNTTYTTEPGQGYIAYKGQQYWLSYEDDQWDDNLWTAGNTYTAEVEVLNKKAPVSVTVKDAFIKSVDVPAISFAEGTGGYTTNRWNEDTQQYELFFYYDWYEALDEITVTLADNTTFTGDLYAVEEFLDMTLYIEDSQSAATPWKAGNTYSATLEIGSLEIPVKVTITASGIQSITFEPVIMPEDADAETYGWNEHLLYTVTFRDGTKLQGEPYEFYYQGQAYGLDTSDDQEDEPWGVGTHTGKVYVAGKEYAVTVYIGKEKTSGSYSYVLYNNKAYITQCDTGEETLTLPTSLGGYSVVGLLDMGPDLATVKDLTLPSAITHLDPDAFWNEYEGELDKLTVGAGVKHFTAYGMYGCMVKEVSVSSNATYCSYDGVVYDKNKTRLVFYPWSKTDSHTVPNTVTDISALVNHRLAIEGLNVTLGTGTKDRYVQEGNFVYTKNKTTLVFTNSTATGSYSLPTTVTKLYDGAFAYTGLTSVTLHSGIRELPEYAFLNCASLTQVEGTDGLKELGYSAFAGCTSLKTFRIPQGIIEINYQAFADSALETVVIPDTVEYVDRYAFENCPLEDVYYLGSEDDWDQIDIDEYGNEPLLNATIHFDGEMLAGDVDGNFVKDTDDAVYLLLSVMFGTEDYPVPEGSDLDFDASGEVNTDDAVYLLLHVMFGAEDYPI